MMMWCQWQQCWLTVAGTIAIAVIVAGWAGQAESGFAFEEELKIVVVTWFVHQPFRFPCMHQRESSKSECWHGQLQLSLEGS